VVIRIVRDLEPGDRIVIDGEEWTVRSHFVEGHTGNVDLDLINDDLVAYNWHAAAAMPIEVLVSHCRQHYE
jgi:hypothetical protein